MTRAEFATWARMLQALAADRDLTPCAYRTGKGTRTIKRRPRMVVVRVNPDRPELDVLGDMVAGLMAANEKPTGDGAPLLAEMLGTLL